MQKKIPAIYMRGGTSKGLFFQAGDLPPQSDIRDTVLLAAYGSPDPNRRQIDGIGGAVSTASKVAIISPSESPDYDVVYNFGQVSIDRPIIDFKGNCGNISSAVGPFAVDEGLVPAVEPITRVRIHQKNTDKLIIAEVPVKNGRFDEEGDYTIAGVPGSSAKIILRFDDPGGALTGKLFPTGNVKDTLEVPDVGRIELTVIDAANPVVLVKASALGLTGIEIEEIDNDTTVRQRLENVRCAVSVKIGLTETMAEATLYSQAVPKIAFITAATSFQTVDGNTVDETAVDLVGRMMSMGTLHKSYAVSGAVSTVGAAMIPGTVAHDLLEPEAHQKKMLSIGHPGGIIEVGAVIEEMNGTYHYREAVLGRTARRLMEGSVLVPEKYFKERKSK